MKFVVFCPDANTGGPFALLQLAKAINDIGYECEVLFYDIGKINPKKYRKNFIKTKIIEGKFIVNYKRIPRVNIPNLSFKICFDLDINDVLIFPEVTLDYSTHFYGLGFKNRVFWWLSWNNAPLGNLTRFNNIVNLKNSIHIFQSKYAQIEAKRLNFNGPIVSDYTIFDTNVKNLTFKKTNDICFLQSKAPGTDKLIKELKNQFSVISIKKMSQIQVIETLKKSKFFIDFGSHPGKDRIPREAALHNCIPLVHKLGAAVNSEDVSIPNFLKLDTLTISDSELLTKKINKLNTKIYETELSLKPYINKIRNERNTFYQEVKNFLINQNLNKT